MSRGWPKNGQIPDWYGTLPTSPWAIYHDEVYEIPAAPSYDDYYPIDPLTPLWEETMKAIHVNPDEPLEWWANLSLIEIDINGAKARARAIQKIQDHLTNTVLSIMGLSELF